MSDFDLVLFDLDGTLVETAPEICDAVNDTLAHFGWPAVPIGQVADWIGHGTRTLLTRCVARARGTTVDELRESGRLEEVIAVYDGCYAKRCGTRSRIYPGGRQTLEALRGRGIRLALVTNKEGRYTDRVLAAHGLRGLFDVVVSGDTLPAKKPDPACVTACLEALAVPAERALYVGDSSIDVQTARNAGVPVWILPHGYNMGEPADALPADRIVPDFGKLMEWLGVCPES